MLEDAIDCAVDACDRRSVVGFHFGVHRDVGDIEIQGGACLDHIENAVRLALRQVLVMNSLVLPATDDERTWLEQAREVREEETGESTLPTNEGE